MQRLSWLMASQSFLFTAYSIVSNGLINRAATVSDEFGSHLMMLAQIIPAVALINSLLIFVSIVAALKAIRELRQQYQRQPGISETIALQTSWIARALGLTAPTILPLLFLIVWLFLLVH
jgi:hypothetical protein